VTAGELLRAARRWHGLTQQQLADRARTSQAAISRIERGLVSPSVDTLAHLLDLLGEELVLDAAPIDYGHDVTSSGRTAYSATRSNPMQMCPTR
jgi:transcriptional regulator with XRE-family HTH domain